MQREFFVRLWTVAALAAVVCLTGARATAQAEDGFVPLFNGTDLTGWSGDPALWRVENGEIVGSTEPRKLTQNTFLSTTKSYSDFVLKVQVKLRNGNSGIQVRSEQLPDYAVAGYQADVAEKTYFGMLYEERKRGILPYWNALSDAEREAIFNAAKQGDWNSYEITMQGHHIKMVLNGKTTVDMDDPDGATAGIIALQLHVGDPMEVRFKDIYIKELAPAGDGKPHYKPDQMATPIDPSALLMPDSDANRSERIGMEGSNFHVPEGFSVEEVANNDLVGSVYNMTFDYKGRPLISTENDGLFYLVDTNGDGVYDEKKTFYSGVKSAMGLCFIAPGDLLVQAIGPNDTALYRTTDTDLDDEADRMQMVLKSDGGIGEHGPHAIQRGPDGFFYLIYGNHSHPKRDTDPASPCFGLQEDHLLPRYVDPRGHANKITAPGGTIHRFDPTLTKLEQVVGGFRNAYDFSIDPSGELWTYDSDMEWDFGLPWYRPTRVIHAIPGGDYGWRTGATKMPFYYLDTLPGVHDVGRGSPVGMCIYEHNVYPERYKGAVFMGDWSRGRVRVLFPEADGATFRGPAVDFVVGEPLNVTDMDVGPDGYLYFSVGGRSTHGGMFRVRSNAPAATPGEAATIDDVLNYPMPRSAWALAALGAAQQKLGDAWGTGLMAAAKDSQLDPAQRALALELLQVHGPAPSAAALAALSADPAPAVRSMAVYLLGTHPAAEARAALEARLRDTEPVVARRACEALLRSGVADAGGSLVKALEALLDHPDRFVRYAARLTLERVPVAAWRADVLALDPAAQPNGTMEGLAALAQAGTSAEDSDALFARLQALATQPLAGETLLAYLRVVELAYLRDKHEGADRTALADALAPVLVAGFPDADWRVTRTMEEVLAHMQRADAIGPMLAYLTPEKSQEEQVHTVYALRAIKTGWTKEQRTDIVNWFDLGRELPGAASMEGYIDNMWTDVLAFLPEDERAAAEAHKADVLQKRQQEALELMASLEEGKPAKANSDLAQMSFEELSEYLEYDPMAYRGDVKQGERVFIRSKCATCHIFGTIGKGGGPDLSTVTSRFRRRDILEAIMNPSKVVSDQYSGVELDLDDLSTVTGMVVAEDDRTLTIITIQGERMEIKKRSIEARREVKTSMMPEGLLGTMSLGDLVSLINFLEKGADL